ncbi:MAG: hypothetical protein HY926_08780 [Elusimicrobia bacterium]|nr:hypothetical protein [Elusimicrobiota bacterium]
MVRFPVYALVLGVCWVAFAALVGRALRGQRGSREDGLCVAALFAVSLLARCWLSAWGPGDLRISIADAVLFAQEPRWGLAPAVFLRPFAAWLPRPDLAIQCVNLVLGSLAACAGYLVLRRWEFSPLTSAAAAGALALHPVLVAFSAVLDRHPLTVLVFMLSFFCYLRYLESLSAANLAAALLGVSLVVQSRPEGGGVLVLFGVWTLAAPMPWRRRLALSGLWTLAAAAACLYLAGYLPADAGYAVFDSRPLTWARVAGSAAGMILWDRDLTPWAVAAAWAAGCLWGARHRPRLAVFALASAALLLAVWNLTQVASHYAGCGLQLASSRYQFPALLALLAGVALGVEALRGIRGRLPRAAACAAALLALAASSPRSYRMAAAPTSVDHEYHFLRSALRGLPAGAVIYRLEAPVNDLGFLSHREASVLWRRGDLRWVDVRGRTMLPDCAAASAC